MFARRDQRSPANWSLTSDLMGNRIPPEECREAPLNLSHDQLPRMRIVNSGGNSGDEKVEAFLILWSVPGGSGGLRNAEASPPAQQSSFNFDSGSFSRTQSDT